jgi:hypothetical protein
MLYRSATGTTSRSMPRLRIECGVFDYQDPGTGAGVSVTDGDATLILSGSLNTRRGKQRGE